MMARFGAVLVVLLVGLMPRLGQAGAPLQARSPVISTGQDRCYALTGKPARRPLPEHLPRESVEHAPAMTHSTDGACGCPSCGKQMRQMGEDVTEVLEYVPESWKVIRHVRPKFSCRVCDTIAQAPATGLLARRLRHVTQPPDPGHL